MNLLELRKKLKKKKPNFLRQDAHKIKSIPRKWRSPKGRHSKMREKRKGRRKQPSIGYSSPKAVRFLSPQGLKLRLIHNVKELEQIKDEGIIIASGVGLKKKLEILKKINEKKLKILNVKNIDNFIKESEEKLKKKKEEKKTTEKKEVKVEAKEEKKEEVKVIEETKEEKEKKEKEFKRKILEQKATKK